MSDNKENIKIKLTLDNLFPKTENKSNPSDIPPLSGNQDIPPVSKPVSEPSSMESLEGLGLKLKTPASRLPGTGEKSIPLQDVKLKIKPAKSVSDSTDKRDVFLQPSKSNEQVPLPSSVSTGQEGEHPSLNIVNTQKEKTQKIILKKETSQKPVINLDEANVDHYEEGTSSIPEESPAHQGGEINKTYFDHFEVVSNSNGKKNITDTVKLQLKPKTASSSAFSTLTSEEKSQENIPMEENKVSVQDSNKNFTDTTVKPAKKNTKYLYLVVALIIMIILLYFLISTIKTLMAI